MLLLDFISPSAVAAATLTSGLSSASAFSVILRALASLGISPNTRIARARVIVLFPAQAASRICHASTFGFLLALGVAVACCPDSFACGCVVGGCAGSFVARGLPEFGGCAWAGGSWAGWPWAGALVCGGAGGVVDCCCANSRHDAS